MTMLWKWYDDNEDDNGGGGGWAKYHDLSVANRSIVCRSRRLRQIIDLRDTDDHDILR